MCAIRRASAHFATFLVVPGGHLGVPSQSKSAGKTDAEFRIWPISQPDGILARHKCSSIALMTRH